MTKLEAIDILKSLNERLKYVDDSYDKETDMKAIEIGIECVEESIRLDKFLKPYLYEGEKQ